MMMWPHSPPWLCRPSMIMPSTTIPPPTPVPSVNITRLCVFLPGTDPVFAIRGRVAVVLEAVGFFEPIGEQLANRQVVPARQVGRVEQHAGRRCPSSRASPARRPRCDPSRAPLASTALFAGGDQVIQPDDSALGPPRLRC